MNENLNLVEILKDCPEGTEFYHAGYGRVWFYCIDLNLNYPIRLSLSDEIFDNLGVTSRGTISKYHNGECLLFPSKDQRDWSKFKVKKPKFDPKTLHPFDRVLVRLTKDCIWNVTFFSHYDKEVKWGCYPFVTTSCKSYDKCIPYNDDTKHLVGTTEEAPEFYRYWED